MSFMRSFKPFSLLLTGAPGWLCDAVLSQLGGALPALTRVRCLIHRGATAEQIQSWRLSQPSATETVEGDLLDAASLRAACANMQGGVILHAAAIFQPKKLRDYYAINRDGTISLASIAKQAGVRRFVFISSTAAQGASSSAAQVLTEAMPCEPYSHYGKSKLEAEQGLMKLHVRGTFDVVILRPGPFYGPPVPPHHLELFKRLKQGRASLVGGGKYARSWSFIEDVAAGAITSLVHPRAAGEIFNLCDAEIYTQRDIYVAAAEALGVHPKFRSVPSIAASIAHLTGKIRARFNHYDKRLHLMADQNRHTGASCEKAHRLIAFEPLHSMHDGIKLAVDWCRDHAILDF